MLLFLILIAVGAYFIYKNSKKKKTAAAQGDATKEPGLPSRAIDNVGQKPLPTLDSSAASLRDEDGGKANCVYCGKSVVGFGGAGGYCKACGRWSYDRARYIADLHGYGESAESLWVLMAYADAHLRSAGTDIKGTLIIMPGQLIARTRPELGLKRKAIRYADISVVSATTGAAQQLTILTKAVSGGQGALQTESVSIDLSGRSYDGADGQDLTRITQLIDEYDK